MTVIAAFVVAAVLGWWWRRVVARAAARRAVEAAVAVEQEHVKASDEALRRLRGQAGLRRSGRSGRRW